MAVAEHVRLLPTTTPVDGERVGVAMVGAVFSTLTLTDAAAVAPLESVAVAVQVIEITDIGVRGGDRIGTSCSNGC